MKIHWSNNNVLILARPLCIPILIHSAILLIFSFSVCGQEIIFPPMTPVCSMDLDNDGDVSAANELKTCGIGQKYNPITDLPGPDTALSCPLGRAMCTRPELNVCSIDGSQCGKFDATCTRPLSCQPSTWTDTFGVTVNGFDCPTTPFNDKFPNQGVCDLACDQTAICNIEAGPMECPLGNHDCINEADGSEEFYCSPNLCASFEDAGVYDPVDSSYVPNDGTVTEDEGCIDEIQIFNGKPESCRLPGAASAFQNCCNQADEDLLSDSQGSVAEGVLWVAGIAAVTDAAAAAYSAYVAVSANVSVGASATYSASAFQSTLIEGLSSTTMIVAVGVAAVTTYLNNACPPEGVVTAIKKKSNQCVLIGEKCTTSFLGACVQKAQVHCCFNSVMATLVQIGGRDQLGMDFGTVDNPHCRGFTPAEFQSIDFSKINLTAYYSELKTRAQGDIEHEITTVIDNAANGI
jgi:conjugal transfer mating pair stabilization protein TraN